MSYGTTALDSFKAMPLIVDRVLKGANPAETPFEVVTRQELIVNLRVARELGVSIPADLCEARGSGHRMTSRADEIAGGWISSFIGCRQS